MKHLRGFASAVAMVMVLMAAASCQKPAASQPASAPTRFTATGSGLQMGQQIGKQYAAQITPIQHTFLATAVVMTQKSKAALYAQAGEIAKNIAPEDLDEIRGLAEGSGLTYEDMLFLNCFYDLTTTTIFCRQIAAWGRDTADGELIHGRNLDWPDYPGQPLEKYNLIVNERPTEGVESLTLCWPGFAGVLTGANKEGLTVAFNQLTAPRQERAAEPTFFTLKRVLRSCKTAAEAVKLIQDAKPLGSGCVLISDAKNKTAVVVEIYAGRVGVRQAGKNEAMICCANHATTDAAPENRRSGPADWPLCRVARKLGKPLTADLTRQCLADPEVLQDINMLSVVFLPRANKMLLSCGRMRAAEGTFTEYTLFENK